MLDDILNPPAAFGSPLFNAVLKKQPEDFRVFENLDIELTGQGEHLYLKVEKTAMNTDEVVACLQDCYEVSSADIGLCGLKDRHAVTAQWFSVRTPADTSVFLQAIATFDQEQQHWADAGGYRKSMRLLGSERHARKLKRGAHQSNKFVITLHEVQNRIEAETDLKQGLDRRIQLLRQGGFPNYIGSQRFGHSGQNLQRARQWFGNPRKRTSRQQRSLWLSAARSALFNIVCAARVRAGTWTQLLEGEPAALEGSRSFFATGEAVNVGTEQLEDRLRNFDIHPSAPWWGRGHSLATAACADFESLQLQAYGDVCKGLERAGLPQERRAIRAVARELDVIWVNDNCVTLTFSLLPGVFATVLLNEFCRCVEPSHGTSANKSMENHLV